MDLWSPKWNLIADRNYRWLFMFMPTFSLLAGLVGGVILGWKITVRAYDVRLAVLRNEVAALGKQVTDLRKTDESLGMACGIHEPLPD